MPEDHTTAPEAREVGADPRDVETAAGAPVADGPLGLEPGPGPDSDVAPGDVHAQGEPHSSLERLPDGVAPDGVGPERPARAPVQGERQGPASNDARGQG